MTEQPKDASWLDRARSAGEIAEEAFHVLRVGRPVFAAREWVRRGVDLLLLS
jgi:hypothetical protein